MRHIFFVLALLGAGSSWLAAQNLIPNPGFEDFSKCPKALGQIERTAAWRSPNGGTPDYFNQCYAKNPNGVGVPRNYFGIQPEWEGAAYAGIYAGEQEMEYLQVRLLEPLEAGEMYCLRFFASPATWNADQLSALRVLFSETELEVESWEKMDGLGADQGLDFVPGQKETAWSLMSLSFEAKGGEEFMTVGYFGPTSNKGYTFLDDFGLYPFDAPESCAYAYFTGDALQDRHNFVPNPGFELKWSCPEERSELDRCEGWRVMENTPDFFHVCGTGTATIPENPLGAEEPHQGDAYGGFWCFLSQREDYREFISMTLRNPLEKGEIYCLSMWVSLAEVSSHTLDDLQMMPARAPERIPSKVSSDDPRLVFLTPATAGPIEEQEGWAQITALFIANGGEQILTIGNFRKNEDSRLRKVGAPAHYKPKGRLAGLQGTCYYYVDDVSLARVESPIAACPDDQSPQMAADPDFPELTAVVEVEELPEEAPVEWEVGDTLVLEHFLFAFDAADLAPEATPILDTLAAYLGRHPELRVAITGHTDDQGTENYNLRLSRERAASVADYLQAQGADAGRISSAGAGESQPLVPNDSEDTRARNRRVEIRFLEE